MNKPSLLLPTIQQFSCVLTFTHKANLRASVPPGLVTLPPDSKPTLHLLRRAGQIATMHPSRNCLQRYEAHVALFSYFHIRLSVALWRMFRSRSVQTVFYRKRKAVARWQLLQNANLTQKLSLILSLVSLSSLPHFLSIIVQISMPQSTSTQVQITKKGKNTSSKLSPLFKMTSRFMRDLHRTRQKLRHDRFCNI